MAMVGLASSASASAAEPHWSYKSEAPSERSSSRFSLAPRISIWNADFKRPGGQCARGFCQDGFSSEWVAGLGLEVAFQLMGPFHVTAALDFLYSEPNSFGIQNQVIINVPVSILITFPEWIVRPIAQAQLTPILYVTDDSRDYTLGANGGAAVRIARLGSVFATFGYHVSETLKAFEFQVGLQPILW